MECHYRKVLVLCFLCLPFAAACSRAARPVASQPPPATIKAAESAAPTDGQTPLDTPLDTIAQVLIAAQEHSERGEAFLRNGIVGAAREEFEAALDLLRAYSRGTDETDFEVEREIDFLIVRIETLETAQRAEKAAIDDLASLETSIKNLDPGLRARAELNVAEGASDFPIQLHDRVLSLLEYYTEGAGRRTIELGLDRIGIYGPMIRRVFAEEGLPLDLIYVAQAESAFKPQALSSALAKGMWQFISSRGKEYGLRQNWWIDERSDPEKSTRAAARHLKDLSDQFGDWYLAMAAYNSGPARVRRAIDEAGVADFWSLAEGRLLPRETRNYVPTVLAMALIGRNPTRYGFDVHPADPLEVERVRVEQATDLRVIAEYLELPLEEIRDLNPHVLRWATPPEDAEFELILPAGYAGTFREIIAPLPEDKRILFRYHVVSKGETLSHLAQRYGVSVAAIGETNRVGDRHVIRVGQSLVIPLGGVPIPATAVPATFQPADRIPPPEIYPIRRGDTLSQIAVRFGLSVQDIKLWNGMSSNRLIAGKSLRLVPADREFEKVVYNVRPGDTLSEIAFSHKTSVDEIRAWNRESDLSTIRPGDEIMIFMDR